MNLQTDLFANPVSQNERIGDEEQFFKEKLIRENGYKPMLTLVCRKCGYKQIIIYTGNNNIPCPGCKKRR